jgi:hypothetical protein
MAKMREIRFFLVARERPIHFFLAERERQTAGYIFVFGRPT